MTTYLLAGAAVLLVFQSWLLWRVLSQLGAVERFESRLSVLSHTMALLTDTMESGLQAMAAQLEQHIAQAPVEKSTRQRRVIGAARKGRSITDIAAEEQVAESEVRLRLHLADQKQPQALAKERGNHGSLRA